jgi:hypothetical protein
VIFAETDFPWVIAMMVVIAFFQWLVAKLKGIVGSAPTPAEDLFADEDLQPPRPTSVGSAPPPIPQPSSPPNPPRTLQDWKQILEAMRQAQVLSAQPAPPPIPVSAPTPAPASLPMIVPPVAPATRMPLPARLPRRLPASGTARITPQAIRDAVILKEILDPPLALREDEPR